MTYSKEEAVFMTGHENNAVLLKRARSGDPEAESELISCNMGLVKSIAVRFLGRGEELDDLIQLGSIGLLKAARGYDESYGTAFSTYAVPMIIGEIRRFLRDNGPIKVGRSVKQLGIKIMRERERCINECGREPTVTELSEKFGVEKEDIVNALDAAAPVVSLQDALTNEDDGFTLESLVGESDDIGALIESVSLEKALAELPESERLIVLMRYSKGLTQAQVGEILGYSQVKVSRMEKKIMEKLRGQLVS